MAHEKVHELLVQFVSENQGSFRPYIDGYLAKMKCTRVWSTAVELLAVASLLQIPVFTLIPYVNTYRGRSRGGGGNTPPTPTDIKHMHTGSINTVE